MPCARGVARRAANLEPETRNETLENNINITEPSLG